LEGAIFASTPDHLGRVKDHLRQQGVADVRTKRFRGLGSIDVEILKSRCVDRKTRDLSVLTHEHAENALALFDQLRRVGKSPAEGK
jgi:DNA gyrase/topoisomerase IV subunit B